MTTKDVLALALKALEKSKSALAEELAAWDIDPPLHHVNEAHDLCDAAITAFKQAQESKVKLIPTADEMGTPMQPQAITAGNGQAQELVGYVSKQHGKLLIKDTLTNPNETEEGGYVWKLVTWVDSTPKQEKAS